GIGSDCRLEIITNRSWSDSLRKWRTAPVYKSSDGIRIPRKLCNLLLSIEIQVCWCRLDGNHGSQRTFLRGRQIVTCWTGADAYRSLPLHFNLCRTTLKNEASAIQSSGSILFLLLMVTIVSAFTCIGF